MAVIIGVARETAPGERRTALTPETCRKFVAQGARLHVERGAMALANAGLVLCVQPPDPDRIRTLREGAMLVGILQPEADPARADALRARVVRGRRWTC